MNHDKRPLIGVYLPNEKRDSEHKNTYIVDGRSPGLHHRQRSIRHVFFLKRTRLLILLRSALFVTFCLPESHDFLPDLICDAPAQCRLITEKEEHFEMDEEWSKNDGCEKCNVVITVNKM
jgi:hypothetical protein